MLQIVSGSILPIWPVVESALKKSYDPYTGLKRPARINIARVSLVSEAQGLATAGAMFKPDTRSLIGIVVSSDRSAEMVFVHYLYSFFF